MTIKESSSKSPSKSVKDKSKLKSHPSTPIKPKNTQAQSRKRKNLQDSSDNHNNKAVKVDRPDVNQGQSINSKKRKRKNVPDSARLQNDNPQDKAVKVERPINQFDSKTQNPKNVQDPSNLQIDHHENKVVKVGIINQNQSVNSSPAKDEKATPRWLISKRSKKKQSGPKPEKDDQVSLNTSSEKVKVKPKPLTGPSNQSTTAASSNNVESKSKKKSKKRKIKKDISLPLSDKDSKIQYCFQYLDKWKNDKKNWKFEKNSQMRLFASVFKKEQMPENSFKIFLEYMDKGSEASKTLLKFKANERVSAMEEWESLSEEDKSGKEAPDKSGYERARSVLQHLK